MEKIKILKNKKLLLFLMFVLTTTLTFANTTGPGNSFGFDKFIQFINYFFLLIKWVAIIAGMAFIIWKAIELIANFQMAEFFKAVMAFVIVIAIVLGTNTIVVALGGNVVDNRHMITEVEYDR